MSRWRRWAILSGVAVATWASPGAAVQTPPHLRGVPSLDVASGPPVRAQRAPRWGSPRAAQLPGWRRLANELGPGTRASWDLLTGVPSRVIGAGAPAPGSSSSAEAALRFARSLLHRHLALLAPGALPADFVAVSNHFDGSLRTVGFEQWHDTMPVIGGQLSFRFKNDRLFAIGSEALPHVKAELVAEPIADGTAGTAALSWVAPASTTVAQVSDIAGPFVLPLLRPAGPEYVVVLRIRVATRHPIGQWYVYVDAADGSLVAREQLLRFAVGTVLYDAPQRYATSLRADYAAAHAALLVDGVAATTDATGTVSFADPGPADVLAMATGPYRSVHNEAGPDATANLALSSGGTAVWSAPDDEYVDAQLSAYVHAGIVRHRVLSIDPSIDWLQQPLAIHVNIDDYCNAHSDGESIYFYRANGQCQNTARLADVIYHEYGHSLHFQSLIEGVGAYESGLSEGLSDYLATTITGDPALAPGFFYDYTPLRFIDPFGYEYVWPDDIGESHTTGLIIGGALWDLRSALIAKLGNDAGVARADHLMVQGMRRAVDIPSMYPEVLAADDDDGNLANGTPNLCEINHAFGLHGLRAVTAAVTDLDVQPPDQDGYRVVFTPEDLWSQCPADDSLRVELEWRLRGAPTTGGTLDMLPAAAGYSATIPTQLDGRVVQYRVTATFADDSQVAFPNNPADRYYEFFVGHVEPIYCTDFETDPASDGWTHGVEQVGGQDEWQWGAPNGPPASGDPPVAFDGQRVFGQDLGLDGGDGRYPPDTLMWAESPTIDTSGYDQVRLQYRRWLRVEDGFYDHGRILANGAMVWTNHDSQEEGASLHHLDGEWRFHDVDLTDRVNGDAVSIRFELSSDPGLHFGGWTLDQWCVVGFVPTECGDGQRTGAEECDQGEANSDREPNACRTDCRLARCGDGTTDSYEECDDGNGIADDGCEPDCTEGMATVPDGGAASPAGPIVVEQCGCRVAGRPAARTIAAWLWSLALALGWRRRNGRRRAARSSG